MRTRGSAGSYVQDSSIVLEAFRHLVCYRTYLDKKTSELICEDGVPISDASERRKSKQRGPQVGYARARIFIHNVDSYIGKALVKELRKAEGSWPETSVDFRLSAYLSLSPSLSLSLSLSLYLSISLSLSLCLSHSLSVSLSLSLSLSPLAATPAYRRASSGFGLSCQSLSPNNVVRPAVAWGLEQDRIDVLVCLSTRLNLLWIVGSMPSCSCGLRVAVLVSRFLQGSQVYAGGRVA